MPSDKQTAGTQQSPSVRREERGDGYVRYRLWCPVERRERYVYEHQLVALLDGADPAKVFSDGEHHVHHRNGHRFDNRRENLQVERSDDHARLTFGYDAGEVEG